MINLNQISFVLYTYFYPILGDFSFFNTIQEFTIFDSIIYIISSNIINMFTENTFTINNNSIFLRISIIIGVNIVLIIVSLLNNTYFPYCMNYLWILGTFYIILENFIF